MPKPFGKDIDNIEFSGSVPGSPKNGQIWYDSTVEKLVVAISAPPIRMWNHQSGLPRAGCSQGGGFGVKNATGMTSPFDGSVRDCYYECDGIQWSTSNDFTTARRGLGEAGSITAGLNFLGCGGAPVACTEEYNGSTWSAGGAAITVRWNVIAAGTQTAGLSIGGFCVAGCACVEEYNGTSWAAGGALAAPKRYPGGLGTQTAALRLGGCCTSYCCDTEEYNGTTWSASDNILTARDRLAGFGLPTAALAAYGYDGANCSCSEEYDGVAWSATADPGAPTARRDPGYAGTSTDAVVGGGAGTTYCTCTTVYEDDSAQKFTVHYL